MSGLRLRFDEYQDRCLYDPDHGFYSTSAGAGARGGDFLTSPEVGPLFGTVLARWVDESWEAAGSPTRFDLVEVAAGRGALAAAIHRAAPRCARALHHVLVERSAPLRARAIELLGDRVEVRADLPERVHGVVVANELLDNLPVRILVRGPEGWSEVYVHIDGAGASERLVPLDAAALDEVPAALVAAADGAANAGRTCRWPWHAQGSAWVTEVLGRLGGGGRLRCIDYGVATSTELQGRTWLRTYVGHERGDDPYEDPMGRDITVDVAFDQLPVAHELVSQAEFLERLGIDALVAEGRRIWQERAHLGDLTALAARSRVNEAAALVNPRGLGGFLTAEWRVPTP